MLVTWVICTIFNIFIAMALGEMCSLHPVVGSIYQWSAAFSPSEAWAPVFSYTCGWLYLLGCIAQDCALAVGTCQSLSAIFMLISNGNSFITVQMEVILSLIMLVVWGIKNQMSLLNQGIFENISVIIQLLSFLIMTSVIILFSPQLSDKDFVFSSYSNLTGFPDGQLGTPYVSVIGITMAVYCLSAYESGATLSEETVKGSVAAPKGMVQAVFYSGMAGFIFIIALLFAMRDNIDGILAGPTAMPIVNIFVLAFTTPTDNGTSQETPLAALLLTILLFLNMFANGLSHMTITVRIAYAMARDNAVPFSFLMGRINPVTKIPDRAVVGVFIVDSLVCLLPLVSASAFAAVTSLTSIGL